MAEITDDLPCPFCGGTKLETGGDDKFVGVRCLTCEATGPNHYGLWSWSDRAARPASAGVEVIARQWAVADSQLASRDAFISSRGLWDDFVLYLSQSAAMGTKE